MHFLELRHAQCEPPPAAYSPVLESYGDVQTVLLGTDRFLPIDGSTP